MNDKHMNNELLKSMIMYVNNVLNFPKNIDDIDYDIIQDIRSEVDEKFKLISCEYTRKSYGLSTIIKYKFNDKSFSMNLYTRSYHSINSETINSMMLDIARRLLKKHFKKKSKTIVKHKHLIMLTISPMMTKKIVESMKPMSIEDIIRKRYGKEITDDQIRIVKMMVIAG